jgi:dihydroorotate dehydrogenase
VLQKKGKQAFASFIRYYKTWIVVIINSLEKRMKSDKELNNKVREINLSGYWVKSRLDPLYRDKACFYRT